ncbi:MAG: CDP-alcohol phosphatidyltransferase family protein, partial [Candidatus Caldipriscus sp.]|nr:CDP-alcohol phosphatidyltransferase family protein [Candidatus Caldipriscus sp.]
MYQDRHRIILKPLAEFMAKMGIQPNFITLFSFLITSSGVIWILLKKPLIAFLWFLLSAPLDAVDGYVARISGKVSRFGAFLDSTLDRITDSLLFLSLIFVFGEDPFSFFFLSLSLVSAYLISYMRARVEGLGENLTEGLMSRYPRFVGFLILLLVWGIFGEVWLKFLLPVYSVLLVITVFQRLILAYRKLKDH